jgi:hypothetical protein
VLYKISILQGVFIKKSLSSFKIYCVGVGVGV